MKHKLSVPVLTAILVVFAGLVFPFLFSIIDKILRSLLFELPPLLLTGASFAWLLLFYYYGIRFSLEYITRQFEIEDTQKLFAYSNIGYSATVLLFYSSLISASLLSNLIWGVFYLCSILFFYRLSSAELLQRSA